MDPIEQYYDLDNHDEWERLDRHRTEFAVTLRALAEYLPPPANILDVGGGPGRYAIELTQSGYNVTLLDLAQASLARAAEKASEAGIQLASIHHGNALDLSVFASSTYDAVLLLGPLYHLLTHEDRRQAIREAQRVLKPGALIYTSFLTLFAAFRVCAERFPEWVAEHPEYVEQLFNTGVHQGEWGFTHAYYTHPTEIVPFMEQAGFSTLQLIGCEGVVAGCEESVNRLTGAAWEWWADLNYRLGKDPALHGAAIHLLYVGRNANEWSR